MSATADRAREVIAAAVETLRAEGVVCWLAEDRTAGKYVLEVYLSRFEDTPGNGAPAAPARAGGASRGAQVQSVNLEGKRGVARSKRG